MSLRTALNISLDAQVAAEIVVGNADAKFKLLKNAEKKREENSIMFVVSNRIVTKTISLPPKGVAIDPQIRKSILALTESEDGIPTKAELLGNFQRFFDRCGDEFISAVTYGSEYFGVLTFTMNSAEEKKQMLNTFGAKGQAKGVPASAGFDASSEKSMNALTRNIRFTFWSHQDGGDYSHLKEDFEIGVEKDPSGDGSTGTFGAGNSSLFSLINRMIKAGKDLGKPSKNPDGSRKEKTNIISADTFPYLDLGTKIPMELRALINGARASVRQSSDSMKNLIQSKTKLEDVRVHARNYVKMVDFNFSEDRAGTISEISRKDLFEVENQVAEIDSRISSLKSHISDCKRSFATCKSFQVKPVVSDVLFIRKTNEHRGLDFSAKMDPIFCKLKKSKRNISVNNLRIEKGFGNEVILSFVFRSPGRRKQVFSLTINSYFLPASFSQKIREINKGGGIKKSMWERMKEKFGQPYVKITKIQGLSLLREYKKAIETMVPDEELAICRLNR